ncbi:MAG: hydantoinase/oxoprolinase family protein [Burkholderiales bacterium]|nr:hydantoinase/oxoprolinase family protein [Burkholderiales bacterium]
MAQYSLGIDIGGTFTDIVLVRQDGALFSKKLLSTPADYSIAIEDGVAALLEEADIRGHEIVQLAHGTTIATNAIIERRGAVTALITTRGFRDVLELGRFRSPRLYDLKFRKPDPLVERRLRFEVSERCDAEGNVLEALDLAELARIAAAIEREGVTTVAICFINAHVNPTNERAAIRYLAERLPHVSVSASTELVPQIGEYERTSTTVVNAYLRPVVEHYVTSLERRLEPLELAAPLMIMQSSGGVLPAPLVAKTPIFIIESGPAAGALGGQRLSEHLALGDLIVFDMGGTTAKACIVQAGQLSLAPETEVGGSAALGARMIKGAGFIVQVPTIDIAEVGAGGGSIAQVDAAGGMQVGPRSAGAEPGPVCYDRGGTQPTVTDANLLLGYLNPDALVGGDLKLDYRKAQAAVEALGARAGLSVIDAAYGIHLIVNATMMRALQAVTSERGRDPSQFSLLAIGGNGGVHAANLAESLHVGRIIVPPVAGLFSALGMLFADVEHQFITAFFRRLDGVTAQDINDAVEPYVDQARGLLEREGYGASGKHDIGVYADVKYVGQTAPLSLRLPALPVTAPMIAELRSRYSELHQQTYGYRSDREPLQFVSLKIVGRGIPDASRVPERVSRDRESAARESVRRAYFGPELGWRDARLLARAALGAAPVAGPLIIEEYDTTTVVRPLWSARTDGWNNIILERETVHG